MVYTDELDLENAYRPHAKKPGQQPSDFWIEGLERIGKYRRKGDRDQIGLVHTVHVQPDGALYGMLIGDYKPDGKLLDYTQIELRTRDHRVCPTLSGKSEYSYEIEDTDQVDGTDTRVRIMRHRNVVALISDFGVATMARAHWFIDQYATARTNRDEQIEGYFREHMKLNGRPDKKLNRVFPVGPVCDVHGTRFYHVVELPTGWYAVRYVDRDKKDVVTMKVEPVNVLDTNHHEVQFLVDPDTQQESIVYTSKPHRLGADQHSCHQEFVGVELPISLMREKVRKMDNKKKFKLK
ncbi:MAG: hypothetical protein HY832_00685 [Candidatus Aenigmarchaeota archaeon]|nr:hypothetical protein [Candidatus Aenigmarchaeota archaeon]